MWSEIQPNGKIKYIERYKDPLTLKLKKVSVTLAGKDTAQNRKKAMESLQAKINRQMTETVSVDTTLGDLCRRYLAYQEETVKASTVERNTRTLNKLVKAFDSDAIVNNLTTGYITDKLLKMDGTNVTRNEYIRRFKAMLNWGRKMDLHQNYKICENLDYFKEEQNKRERIQDKYLEPEEADQLLQYMSDRDCWRWYHLTRFLLLSGLRIGEAVALEQTDVTGDYIHVSKTYDHINDIVTPPKTLTSNRDVFIQPELDRAIRTYRVWQKEDNYIHGVTAPYFFNSIDGHAVRYFAYEKFLRESAEKVLGRKISAHTLRHTHASLLLAAGVPIETISRRLGHENSKITKEIYLHVTAKLVEADNNLIRDTALL